MKPIVDRVVQELYVQFFYCGTTTAPII